MDEDQQVQAAIEAHRFTPQAFAAREGSQTAYEHLGAGQARKLAREVFPHLVNEPGGGAPSLSGGGQIVGYPADNVAQVALPAGGGRAKRAVVESVEPMALETSPGHRTPLDLHLRDGGRDFQPVFAAVKLGIPKRLSAGIGLARTGVSLTPVNAAGTALLGSEGEVDGATVMYANTLTDGDTVVKPATLGFSAETLLRSVNSPRELYFHVGMPAGAHLVATAGGGASVVAYGQTIATVLPPAAHDAEGTPVPVSMSVTGTMLTVTVAPFAGAYRLPIVVDPTVEDSIWQNEWYYSTYYRTNWHFEHAPEGKYFFAPEHPENGSWTEAIKTGHSASEWGGLFYTTRNESQIIVAHAEGHWDDREALIQNYMVLYVSKSPYLEDYDPLPVYTEAERGGGGYACSPEQHCPETIAGSASAENHNTAGYEQESTGTGAKKDGFNTVTKAYVEIAQEKSPTIEFNKTNATVYNERTKESVPNVLYGSGEWLSPHHGGFEVRATDPGIGISEYRVLGGGWGFERYFFAEGQCAGIQCTPEYGKNEPFLYNGRMGDGEESLEAFANDKAGLYAVIYPQTLKVDGTPPHGIKITGFQNGSELPLGETPLTVEATDGEGTTKSSGVKSITVSVDGHQVPGSAGSCPSGPCNASTKVTLTSRGYTTGVHSLVVTATDNALNVAQEEFTFHVGAPAPVQVGPGSVDPNDGQLTLSASDVSLGGTAGLSRAYQSHNLTAGAGGPLGPQWAMNVGGDESLTVLGTGPALLEASGGATTTFTPNGKGGFESPKGDSNVGLEPKEKEPGKGISAYVVTDATAGSSTKFEQPAGVQSTAPTVEGQFGEEAGELKAPVSAAIDSTGRVWVTNYNTGLVEKFSAAGGLLKTYGSYGSENGQFILPWGIAIDSRNGNVYVSDQGNNRIDEMSSSGAFIKTFGWGVSNGSAEFEICTKECKAGLAGAGNGQFKQVAGVTVDSSGNVWVADYGNNRIQEFNEKGEYAQAIEKVGTEGKKLEGPLNTAFSGGNLYVTDNRNNTVQEYATSGAWQRQFGAPGSANGQFSGPYGIATDPATGNLYVSDPGNTRVQEFTPTGTFLAKFGRSGTGEGGFAAPYGITVSASGGVYVVDFAANDVSEWRRSRWVPVEAGGAANTTTYTYTSVEEEGNIVMAPHGALAPLPTGVSSCNPLVRGCRSLTFEYAETTSASGENASQWGQYKGHLNKVWFHAYNPATKAMAETAVAQYAYDKQGRLRAEWDPRITPTPLKTTYGYDQEGHVTAVSPPGQQPWLIHYGTTEGDPSTGRVASVIRPSASTPLGNGEAPQATTAPSLSTSKPVVGEAVTTTKGEWSHSPLTYGYQWERCITETLGTRCEPIEGATNPSYTPLKQDRGKKLRVSVTATNATGSALECSAKCTGTVLPEVGGTSELAQEPLPTPPPAEGNAIWTVDYHVPAAGTSAPYPLGTKEAEGWAQKKDLPVEGAAIFPPDEPMGWPAADYKRATIHYFDKQGRMVNTATPGGGIATSEYNATNDVVRTLSADNRAASLKEGSKSAEMAQLLDTESRYSGETTEEQTHETEEVKAGLRAASEPGTELLETRGPQHKVKLVEGGAEVFARNHVKYFYDEGSPENHHYGLATKTTDGAEYEGKEADVRTTLTSYSGQEGLGWKLRKPTSTVTDPAGLDLVKKTMYEPVTGNVLKTEAPGGAKEFVYPPAYSAAFGSEGSGNGQFNHPETVATDASGNVWVVDMENSRLEKLSASGTFIAAYGSKGSASGQYSRPWGVAINQGTGNVYVSDTGNNRVEELSSTGTFVMAIGWGVKDGKAEAETCTTECKTGLSGTGNGQFHEPTGLAIDAKGNIWVTDEVNDRVEEFSSTGTYISQFGSPGAGNGQLNAPIAIAIDEGELFVVDNGNNRVEEFSPSGTYLAQFGATGTGQGQFNRPSGIAVNPNNGDLYISDANDYRVEEFSPAGKFLTEVGSYGTGTGQFHSPIGMTVNAAGDLYVADVYNARIQEWLPPGAGGTQMLYSTQFGAAGSGNGQFNSPRQSATDGQGNLWVSDYGNHRIQEFSNTGKFLAAYGSYGTGNGQFEQPTGIDVNQGTGNVYVADCADNRIQELSSSGEFIRTFGSHGSEPGQFSCPAGVKIDASGNVWVADSGNNRIEKFSSTGTFGAAYGSAGSGNLQFKEPWGITFSGGNLYVADYANNRIEELSSSGSYLGQFGTSGNGGGQFHGPETIATDAAGNLYVVDNINHRVEEFSASGTFLSTFGSSGSGEGQFSSAEGIAINAAGDIYISDSGNRIEEWMPADQAVHDTQTIYYSAKEEAEVTECRNHPEWAGLPCQTQPAAQPPDAPELPVTTIAYNMWDEIEATTEKFGATTRVKAETYDPAGRALTSETTSTIDKPLPKVTNTYNTTTGALEKQSTEAQGATQTTTSKANTLGELVEYTDADGNTAKYTYDLDGRIEELSEGKGEEAKGSQSYAYDPTTGNLTTLVDSGAGKFTAEYDVEGKMVSESYPNGMTASYIYDPTGEATSVEYVKKTHCTEKCTWFSNSIVPSIAGATLLQNSTLATERYNYDNAGRPTEVQEEPAGKSCVTRLYTYDEESNRTNLTTREGSIGKCATEGGTTEHHTYDPANRLTDIGVSYETFGNTTKLPAADTGSYELTNTYYVDNQLESQKQHEETINYRYDPVGRTRETISEGRTNTKAISHYAGPGQAATWTSEGSGTWTRNIAGIGGSLGATQTSAGTVTLQLADLQGNIIATASISETETKLQSTYNSTEFGVPQPGTTPPKYAWLGASGLSTETGLSSGIANPGGTSYVPLTGRALQTQSITPAGEFPDGTGYAGVVQASYLQAAASSIKGLAVEHEAALQAAARKQAEEEAARNGCPASECGPSESGPVPTEGGAEEAGAWEDPERSILLTTRQAFVAATAMRHGPGALEALAKSGVIKGLSAFLAERLAEIGKEYLQGLALGLETCYTAINSSSGTEARCKLYVDWVTEPLEEKNRIVAWGVETCWGARYKRRNGVHWTFPYCYPAIPG